MPEKKISRKEMRESGQESDLSKNKLINCLDCGQKVSSKATTCPSCGRPTERKVNDLWLLIAVIFPFVGILAGTYFAVKERNGSMAVIILSLIGFGIYYAIFYISLQSIFHSASSTYLP